MHLAPTSEIYVVDHNFWSQFSNTNSQPPELISSDPFSHILQRNHFFETIPEIINQFRKSINN